MAEPACCIGPRGQQPSAEFPAVHPLDQLSHAEVSRAAACTRGHAAAAGVPGTLRFNTVMLEEPAKLALVDFYRGRAPAPPRRATVWATNPPIGDLFEGVVELAPGGDRMVSWRLMEGMEPTTTPCDNVLAEEIILADEKVMGMVRDRYGIVDRDLIVFDPWTLHGTPKGFEGRRLMQGFLYVRKCEKDNEYAHPLDLVPLVDLNLGKVVHIECYDRPAKCPPAMVNYHVDLAEGTVGGKGWRTDVKPINITQPEGPSFTIEGNLVKWQKWQLRVGFNPREGLVLHNIGWEEGDRVRPILYRASLVEMAVPYGDPNEPYVRKCAFDVGDYGMGFTANSLELGCDCVGHIKYFDGVVNNHKGEPMTIRNAICLHEEDAGMLWKHTDTRLNHVEVRRNRRLVVSMVSTFANYEYAMYWNFYIDGTMSLEMKLTGILSTSLKHDDGPGALVHGIDVSPGVVATNHQHLFCVRLDPAIDCEEGGKDLVITEINADRVPIGPHNPHGNAFKVSETPLLTVHQAMREAAPERSRAWKVKNPAVINPITGQPVGFKLVPTHSTPMLMQPESLVGKRAFFATKHLFVTPHDDSHKFPAGDHVVQSEDCLGLKLWTKEDKPLAGSDPVIWHSFGITHLPRLEDFPIMPVEVVGFTFKPWGFHKWNPTLDLPPTRNAASKEDIVAASRPAAPRPRM